MDKHQEPVTFESLEDRVRSEVHANAEANARIEELEGFLSASNIRNSNLDDRIEKLETRAESDNRVIYKLQDRREELESKLCATHIRLVPADVESAACVACRAYTAGYEEAKKHATP